MYLKRYLVECSVKKSGDLSGDHPCKMVGILGLDPFGGRNVHNSISVVEELRLMIVLKVYFFISLVGGCYGTEAGQGQ